MLTGRRLFAPAFWQRYALAPCRAKIDMHGVRYEGYDRSVDAHIKNLRHKLEVDPANPRYVLTVYGIGYRFTDEL